MTIRKWFFVPMALFSANILAADYIKLEYAGNKARNCAVDARYYDGSANRFTCSTRDQGTARSNGDVVKLYCDGNDKVRHVEDSQSSIYISSTCGDTWLSKIRVYNDKNNSGKGASQFYKRKNSLLPWLKRQKNKGSNCYRNVNANSTEIRVPPNFKNSGNYSCKYIEFAD